jgi:hypothetical protein
MDFGARLMGSQHRREEEGGMNIAVRPQDTLQACLNMISQEQVSLGIHHTRWSERKTLRVTPNFHSSLTANFTPSRNNNATRSPNRSIWRVCEVPLPVRAFSRLRLTARDL